MLVCSQRRSHPHLCHPPVTKSVSAQHNFLTQAFRTSGKSAQTHNAEHHYACEQMIIAPRPPAVDCEITLVLGTTLLVATVCVNGLTPFEKIVFEIQTKILTIIIKFC